MRETSVLVVRGKGIVGEYRWPVDGDGSLLPLHEVVKAISKAQVNTGQESGVAVEFLRY